MNSPINEALKAMAEGMHAFPDEIRAMAGELLRARKVIEIVGQIRVLGEMQDPPPEPGSLFERLFAAYDATLEAA